MGRILTTAAGRPCWLKPALTVSDDQYIAARQQLLLYSMFNASARYQSDGGVFDSFAETAYAALTNMAIASGVASVTTTTPGTAAWASTGCYDPTYVSGRGIYFNRGFILGTRLYTIWRGTMVNATGVTGADLTRWCIELDDVLAGEENWIDATALFPAWNPVGAFVARNYVVLLDLNAVLHRKSISDFLAGTGSWTPFHTAPGCAAVQGVVIGDNVYMGGGRAADTYPGGLIRMSIDDFEAGTGSWVLHVTLAATYDSQSICYIPIDGDATGVLYEHGGCKTTLDNYATAYTTPVVGGVVGTTGHTASVPYPGGYKVSYSSVYADTAHDTVIEMGRRYTEGTVCYSPPLLTKCSMFTAATAKHVAAAPELLSTAVTATAGKTRARALVWLGSQTAHNFNKPGNTAGRNIAVQLVVNGSPTAALPLQRYQDSSLWTGYDLWVSDEVTMPDSASVGLRLTGSAVAGAASPAFSCPAYSIIWR
jgi:hypothetical protein